MRVGAFFDLLDSALVGSCDAGDCFEPTAAVVLTDDMGWLAMCNRHALLHLASTPDPEPTGPGTSDG